MKIVLFILLAVSATFVQAQSPSKLAIDVVELENDWELIEEMVHTEIGQSRNESIKYYRESLDLFFDESDAAERYELENLLTTLETSREFDVDLDVVKYRLALFYLEKFTEEELLLLKNHYQSDVHKKLVQLGPEVQKELASSLEYYQESVFKHIQEHLAKITEIIDRVNDKERIINLR